MPARSITDATERVPPTDGGNTGGPSRNGEIVAAIEYAEALAGTGWAQCSVLSLLDLTGPDTGRAHTLPQHTPVLKNAYLLKVRQETSPVDGGRMQTYAALILGKPAPDNITPRKSVLTADFTYS